MKYLAFPQLKNVKSLVTIQSEISIGREKRRWCSVTIRPGCCSSCFRNARDQLIAYAKSDPEAIADLVLIQWDRGEALCVESA